MKNNKSIAKNYLYNVAYKILTLFTPLVTTPYISRILGVENIGIYNYTYSIVSYFILFGVMGLSMYGQREIAYVQNKEEERKQTFWQLFFIRVFTLGISSIIFLFYIQNSTYKAYLYIFLFELIAAILDISWLYYGMEEFKVITIRNFIIKIIGVICIFVFVKDSNDLSIYIWSHVLVLLIGNLSLWVSAKNLIGKPKIEIKSMVTHLIPMLILFLPQCIDSVYMILDKIMLGNMSSITEVGLYSQADKIIKIAVTVVTSMGLVMSPKIAASFASGNEEDIKKYLHTSFEFIFIIAIPMMFGVASVASNFVNWFFGEGYDGVIILIQYLSPTIVLLGINSVIGWQYLLSVKREKEFIFSVSIGALSNIVLNIVFIRSIAARGAVVASVISMLIMSIVNFILIRKQISFKYILKKVYKPIIASIIMAISVVFVGKYLPKTVIGTIIQILVGGISYSVILIIMKDKTFISYIYKIMKRR